MARSRARVRIARVISHPPRASVVPTPCSVSDRSTKTRSILSIPSELRWTCTRDAKPVPESSIQDITPVLRRSFGVPSSRSGWESSFPDTFTLSTSGRSDLKIFCHSCTLRQASRRTHSPIETISPVDSGNAMNCVGGRTPPSRVPPTKRGFEADDPAQGQREQGLVLTCFWRIPTDLVRFSASWQREIQPALRDYVTDIQRGKVTPASAPFCDELRIQVRLSEPNHRIGVDEEVISPLESRHNHRYFTSLAFFSHLGQHYGVGYLNYPGRIPPFIYRRGNGQDGWAPVTLTGRSRASPGFVLRVDTGEPGAVGAGGDSRGGAGSHGLPGCRYALSPSPPRRQRSGGWGFRQVTTPSLASSPTSSPWIPWTAERNTGTGRGEGRNWPSAPWWSGMWISAIPPPENDSVLARSATSPETQVQQGGRTFLDRDPFAADLLSAAEASHRSRAQFAALRPTTSSW